MWLFSAKTVKTDLSETDLLAEREDSSKKHELQKVRNINVLIQPLLLVVYQLLCPFFANCE